MKLHLPEKFAELGEITCKEPIYIDVYYVDRKAKVVYFQWDFGMDGTVGLNSFNIKHLKGLKKIILADIIFDIGHAFFHHKGDPNYTHYHWALYAWLKDRVETREYYEN
jgi:hypothetical protein